MALQGCVHSSVSEAIIACAGGDEDQCYESLPFWQQRRRSCRARVSMFTISRSSFVYCLSLTQINLIWYRLAYSAPLPCCCFAISLWVACHSNMNTVRPLCGSYQSRFTIFDSYIHI